MSCTIQNQQCTVPGRSRRRLKIPFGAQTPVNADQQITSIPTAKSVSSNTNQGIFAPPLLIQIDNSSSSNVTVTKDNALKIPLDVVKQETNAYHPIPVTPATISQSKSFHNAPLSDTIFPLLPSTNPLAVCRYIDSILSLCETPEHKLLYLAIRFRLELISTNDNYESLFVPDASPFLQELQEIELTQTQSSSSVLVTNAYFPQSIQQIPETTLENYMSLHSIQETFDFLLSKRDYYNAYLLASSCSNNNLISQLFAVSKSVSPTVFRFLNDIVPVTSPSSSIINDIDEWPVVLLWFIKTIIRAPKGSLNPDILNMQRRYFLKLLLHGYIIEAQLSGIALGYILEPGSYTTFIQNNMNLLHTSISSCIDFTPITSLQNHLVQTMFINPHQSIQRQKIMASTSSTGLKAASFSVIAQIFVMDIKEKQHISPEMLLIAELIEYTHMTTYFYCAAKVRGRFFPPEPKSIFDSSIHQSLTMFPHLLPYKIHETLPCGYIELALRFMHTLLVVIPEKFTGTPFVTSAYDNYTILPSIGRHPLPPAEILPVISLADAVSITNSKKDKRGLQSLATLVWSDSKIRTVKIVPTVQFSAILLPISPIAIHTWSELNKVGIDVKSRKDPLADTAFVAYRLSRQLSEKIFILGALTIRQTNNISTISDSIFPGYDSASEVLPSCNTSTTSECSYENKQQVGSGTFLSNLGKKATAGLGKLFGTLDSETECIIETSRDKEAVSTNQSQFLQQPLQTGSLNPFAMPRPVPTSPSLLHQPQQHNRTSSWLKDASEGVDAPAGPDISFSDDIIATQCSESIKQSLATQRSTGISSDVAFFDETTALSSVSTPAPSLTTNDIPKTTILPPVPVSTKIHVQPTQYATTIRRNAVRSRVGPPKPPAVFIPVSQQEQ